MNAKDRVIDISRKLQAAHAAVGKSAELDVLHASMKAGLDEQAGALGLDEGDLEEIGAAGTMARGGNPKPSDA
jgi:hypothetical protein